MIKFWRTSGKYGPFSNFAPFGFFLDGYYWKTSEHYYQTQKTTDPEWQEQIREANTPKKSKQIALEAPLRPDWEDVKYEIMKTALRSKFEQSNSLRTLLIDTGDDLLVEDSPYDYVWGCGANETGQNLLGQALMEIRQEFQSR
jgi:hypothetical protein